MTWRELSLYTGEYGWGQGGSSCSSPKDYLQSACSGDARAMGVEQRRSCGGDDYR